MGLLKLLRNITLPKKVQEGKTYMYSMPAHNDDDEIRAFDLEMIGTANHQNNEVTNLMMARIIKQNKDKKIFLDLADYVAFEVPHGTEISNEIMQIVMSQYEQEKQEKQAKQAKQARDDNQYYIGRLLIGEKGYTFGNKSAVVAREFQKIVLERTKQKRDGGRENKDGQKDVRAEFLGNLDARGYLEELQEAKKGRKQSPTLKKTLAYFDEQRGPSYDGINMETGDILRIRNVDKVGKDGSGTYLYSAYIYNTHNQNDAEMIRDTPIGAPVCFELQKRLEDVVKDGNIDEITLILQLLSDSKNFENPEKLTYIGGIDKNGQINRGETSNSPAIQLEIEKMQRKFEEQMKGQPNIEVGQ